MVRTTPSRHVLLSLSILLQYVLEVVKCIGVSTVLLLKSQCGCVEITFVCVYGEL